MRLALPVCAMLAVPVSASLGQSAADSLIPKELAVALLSSGYDRELLVGIPARGFPAELLIAGSSVLGSLGGTTVLVSPDPPSVAQAKLARAFQESGWTDPRSSFGRRPGFISSGIPFQEIGTRCKAARGASFSVRPRLKGGSQLWITLTADGQAGACDRRFAEVVPGLGNDSPFPPLPPPDESVVEEASNGRSGDWFSSSAAVQTRLSLREVMRHYAKTMADSGWTLTEEVIGKEASLTSLSSRDKQGRQWQAQLTGTLSRPGAYFLMLHAAPR